MAVVAMVLKTFHRKKGDLFIFENIANPMKRNSVPIFAHSEKGEMVGNRGSPKSNPSLGINLEQIMQILK